MYLYEVVFKYIIVNFRSAKNEELVAELDRYIRE